MQDSGSRSQTAAERSAAFLAEADRYRLGTLTTEQPHPLTMRLGEVARADVGEALRLLFQVDEDVLDRYTAEVRSGRILAVGREVVAALARGGRLFFTGCGATGRLGVLLVAIWREFWQRAARAGWSDPDTAADWERRAVPVMAGGDYAFVRSVEGFEDHEGMGRKQLRDAGVQEGDVVFAVTEGGETPFVIGTAWAALEAGATPYFVYNNPDELLRKHVERSRRVLDEPRIRKWNLTTGPMAVTGSTRMQATSIELAVLVTVLELVLRWSGRVRPPGYGGATDGEAPESLPARFGEAMQWMWRQVASGPGLQALARWVTMECEVYRRGGRVNYYAGSLAADLLTDTAERTPTFSLPAFRKHGDATAAPSWAFLYVPQPDSVRAWSYVFKRPPVCLEWTRDEVRSLVPPERVAGVWETLGRIRLEELLRFRIGEDGLSDRPLGPGDGAVCLAGPEDLPFLCRPDGFLRRRWEEARAAGAGAGLVLVAPPQVWENGRTWLREWEGGGFVAGFRTAAEEFWLGGPTRVVVKMMLNAVSTATMARLGRVMGNVMTWVVPSNGKLIDRATRYICQLTGLGYEAANRLLFEALEQVEERMRSGRTHPPVVGLAVMRHRLGVDWSEAERRFWAETGVPPAGGFPG